jgi:N-acyl homoserine lactone hydrolase
MNMEIKVIKLYEGGFMTESFALGGSGDTGLDPAVTYASSLQNYLIDTGSDVILVDTGLPKETPELEPKEGQKIYQGRRINDYVSALAAAGYTPESVTKILVTHKHPDHTGELRSFPHADIYLSAVEADALKLEGPHIIRTAYTDGPYYNFEKSQKIADGIFFLPAPGHTNGNSIVIAEKDGLFYMIHGDVTYTDTALRQNKLSIVFENKEAAAQTLEQVRTFIKAHPTVYLSTHTPEGIESLAEKRIMKL